MLRGEGGGTRVEGTGIDFLKAALYPYHAKLIRKPAIDSKRSYLSALEKKAGNESLTAQEVLLAVSPENVRRSLLCSLEALLDESVKDVRVLFESPSNFDILHFAEIDNGYVSVYVAGGREIKIDIKTFMEKRPTLFVEPYDGREADDARETASGYSVFRGLWRALYPCNVRAVSMPKEKSVRAYFDAWKEVPCGRRFAYRGVLWAILHEYINEYLLVFLKKKTNGVIKNVTVLDTEKPSTGIAPLFDKEGEFVFFGEKMINVSEMVESLDRIQAALFIEPNVSGEQ